MDFNSVSFGQLQLHVISSQSLTWKAQPATDLVTYVTQTGENIAKSPEFLEC